MLHADRVHQMGAPTRRPRPARLVASGSAEWTVRVWEADTGQPLATLHGHTGGALGVALSADGQLVTSRSFDGTVRLWEASTGTSLRILRPERRYERLDITGLTGVADAQRAALRALGAIDRTPPASDRCAQPNVNA